MRDTIVKSKGREEARNGKQLHRVRKGNTLEKQTERRTQNEVESSNWR